LTRDGRTHTAVSREKKEVQEEGCMPEKYVFIYHDDHPSSNPKDPTRTIALPLLTIGSLEVVGRAVVYVEDWRVA
jgi:hypothetical protein